MGSESRRDRDEQLETLSNRHTATAGAVLPAAELHRPRLPASQTAVSRPGLRSERRWPAGRRLTGSAERLELPPYPASTGLVAVELRQSVAASLRARTRKRSVWPRSSAPRRCCIAVAPAMFAQFVPPASQRCHW